MALIAVHAVVHIVAHTAVIRSCLGSSVANRTLENRIIARIRMARRAHALRVAMRHREPGVVKRSSTPRRRRVTSLASRREPGGHVVGVGRCLIHRSVAAIAIGRKARIVIVHVATAAGNRGVRPGERKPRRAVIESAGSPDDGVMAEVTGGRIPKLNVVDRRRRGVVIALVTSHATCAGQGVVVVDVTRAAGNACVRPGQSESGRRVIERSSGPYRSGVAERAIRRESGGRVARVRRALEIGHVAGRAGRVGGG